jgi:hypothetical protein
MYEAEEQLEAKEQKSQKVWDIDGTDIVRFEITRKQWTKLIEALAGAACWVSPDRSRLVWDAIAILRNANTFEPPPYDGPRTKHLDPVPLSTGKTYERPSISLEDV